MSASDYGALFCDQWRGDLSIFRTASDGVLSMVFTRIAEIVTSSQSKLFSPCSACRWRFPLLRQLHSSVCSIRSEFVHLARLIPSRTVVALHIAQITSAPQNPYIEKNFSCIIIIKRCASTSNAQLDQAGKSDFNFSE